MTTSEYVALKEKSASNSQLEQAAKDLPRRGKSKGNNTDAVSSIPTKQIPHPLKDQYEPINTFTDEFSEQMAQQFIQDLIPESLLASLSEEQLKCQKQELSANLTDSIKSQLYWALNRAWLDAQKNN